VICASCGRCYIGCRGCGISQAYVEMAALMAVCAGAAVAHPSDQLADVAVRLGQLFVVLLAAIFVNNSL